ncbi:MAG: bifunctional (p)ppGpp synthetase/guanosine-3',5'-bis(diphosphate) 3'-pyrophosphohydrolase [Ignavibacteriae bacterium]|nr:bifunctional (p)ppGpp synthetase/guanosine-3',5'-bis(diphosphate) 3'-pyrophosphohydrolase [Ignavibacteriota bacterium]
MTNAKFKKKLDDLLLVCKKNLPKVDEALIRRAFEFGFDAHRNDIRASGEPFFDHPYQVARIVAEEIPLDDVSVASALLHDVAEDTEYQIKDIRAEFGDTIADIVDGATKISDIFKSHDVTQAESYRKMLLSMVDDVRVMLVKFADRLHNMRTLEYLHPEKQKRMARETLDIYAPFAHRFGLANIKWELEDLSFKYLNREAYDMIASELKSRRREREHYIAKFAAPIEKRLKEHGMKFEVNGRPKHFYSIYNKMSARNKPLEDVYDLFAVRIILDTDDSNECFKVYGTVTDIYIPNPERFKNYISVPKKNGYQSIHTTVVGPEGKMVEVQIRTRAMHEVAEKGVAAHWMYKETNSAIDEELSNWVNWVREIFESASEGQVPTQQLMESFKLTLYQDEIYLFTPKGDLKILPKGATPVDFAYEIHSKVGDHCLAAKVNGRIVPLDTQLKSGDQVEIITSKNQTPNPDWEKFAVTHKAKSHIRRWIKEEQRKLIEEGRALWERKVKKAKLSISEDDLNRFLHEKKIENIGMFYLGIRQEKIEVDAIIKMIQDEQKHPQPVVTEEGKIEGLFNRFITTARGISSGIMLNGTQEGIMHNYAKCCHPIPGDDVVGFITTGEGIKIHRRNCKNIRLMMQIDANRFVDVAWPADNGVMFVAGLKVSGVDRPGMLSDITHAISSYLNTNIRSVNLDSRDSSFEGTFILYVKDTEHLNRISDKIRRIKGVTRAERFEE